MSDTQPILTDREWVEFPAGDNFLFQNVGERDIRVVVSAAQPDLDRRGHILAPGAAMTRLTTGTHWHRSILAGHAEFTADD